MASGVFVGLSTIDLVYGVDEFPAGIPRLRLRSEPGTGKHGPGKRFERLMSAGCQ